MVAVGKKIFNDKQSYILTRETLGMTLLLFTAIVTVILLTNKLVFGSMGAAICTFMYGTFGYGSFLVVALLAYLGQGLVFGKKIKLKVRTIALIALTSLCLFLLFHSVTTRDFPLEGYGKYLSECYLAASQGFSGYTFGGVISGLIVYPIARVMTFIAAYVIFAILSVLSGYVTFLALRNAYLGRSVARSAKRSDEVRTEAKPAQPAAEVTDNLYTVNENQEIVSSPRAAYPRYAQPEQEPVQPRTSPAYSSAGRSPEQREADEEKFSREKLGRKILFEPGEFAAESYRRNMIYNESSYFNHPVRSNDDYWRSFSSDKPAENSGAQTDGSQSGGVQGGTSYTQNFAKNAENSPVSGNSPTYIYGDNPVQNLGSPERNVYQSYSVGSDSLNSSDGYDEGEQELDNDTEVSVELDDEITAHSEPEDNSRSFSGNFSQNNATNSFGHNSGFRQENNSNPFGQNSGFRQENNSNPFGQNSGFRQENNSNPFGQNSGFRQENTPNPFGQNGSFRQADDSSLRQSAAESTFGDSSSFDGRGRSEEINDRLSSVRQVPVRPVQPERGENEIYSARPENGVQPEQPASSAPSRGDRNSLFNLFSSSNPRLGSERNIEPDVSALSSRDRSRDGVSRENIFDSDDDDTLFGGGDLTPDRGLARGGIRSTGSSDASVRGVSRQTSDGNIRQTAPSKPIVPESDGQDEVQPVQPVRPVLRGGDGFGDSMTEPVTPAPVPEPVKEEPPKPKHVWKKYVRPSLDLLDDYPENNNVNTAEIEESKQIICDTLEGFRIASEISNVVVGPAITRYDVIIKDKTNIKNALKYRESIAMALMKENVNAYLNYSKGAISVEVPNSSRSVVGLKGILASSQFINSKPNSLCFAFGKNVDGKVVCPDITKMPHLLVAGTTGSGKSICLSALIISLLYKYGPEDLRFILVDPKQVEFISYDKLPHLMINEIIYDVDKAIKALNWAIKEMERRYQLFKEMTEKGIATKNLSEYNAHLEEGEEKLPKIVIILDEFGDLMLQAKKDIEGRIIRLVQKARACGIHLILATQRPSVDCITGLIKSNLPTRIGFKVNSFDDSRCIFDIGGAEKLLGKGDCYFRSAESPELARIQGCFIDTPEVQRVTDFIKQNNETYFDQSVSDFINTVEEPQDAAAEDTSGGVETKIDDTFIKALKFCVTSNQASVSMIQRRFPIGYMKACKIIDWMENMNYVTQSEGSKPRKVLLSKEEFVRTYGEIDD